MFMPSLHYNSDIIGLYMDDMQKYYLNKKEADEVGWYSDLDVANTPAVTPAFLLYNEKGWIMNPIEKHNIPLKVIFNSEDEITVYNATKNGMDKSKFNFYWTLDVLQKYKPNSVSEAIKIEQDHRFEAKYIEGKINFID